MGGRGKSGPEPGGTAVRAWTKPSVLGGGAGGRGSQAPAERKAAGVGTACLPLFSLLTLPRHGAKEKQLWTHLDPLPVARPAVVPQQAALDAGDSRPGRLRCAQR